jgi:hypothetical protein
MLTNMMTKQLTNVLLEEVQKIRKEQIRQYDEMLVDETSVARIVGTWRTVTSSGVGICSFSGVGKLHVATRTFDNAGNYMLLAYKVSTNMLAQRTHDEAFALANPKLIADSAAFHYYEFNDDNTELRLDLNGVGLELASIYERIDDGYMEFIDDDLLDVPRNASPSATLVWANMWQQPQSVAESNGARSRVKFQLTTLSLNGIDVTGSGLHLPEGEYEVI